MRVLLETEVVLTFSEIQSLLFGKRRQYISLLYVASLLLGVEMQLSKLLRICHVCQSGEVIF